MSEPNDRPNLGYSEADGVVTLRMMRSDFEKMLLCLGYASAHPAVLSIALGLVNRLNRGNPYWFPRTVPDAPRVPE